MSDTDLPNEDDVLRRMLNTPPKPHKPLGDQKEKRRPAEDAKAARAKGELGRSGGSNVTC